MRPPYRTAALLMLALTFAGCAVLRAPHDAHLASADGAVQACAKWYRSLDRAVKRAGVADIGARRIDGFPYLRTDRFTASFANAAGEDTQVFDAWVSRMRALAEEGRAVELANLPASAYAALGVSDAGALDRSRHCAGQLAAADLASEDTRRLLVEQARVEDDYSGLKRAVGLYPLVQFPFSFGVEQWHRQTRAAFEAAAAGARPAHPLRRYVPPAGEVYARDQVAALLARADDSALGVPELSPTERDRLFHTYAPVIEVETTGEYDRIGRLHWAQAAYPGVDVSQPLIYRDLAYTRLSGRTLVQLVYTAWFPQRPGAHAFDLLAGRLDGLVWRVTLAPDGSPLLFDSIHPCGCYHLFFPTPRLEPVPSPGPLVEWAFSPAAMPVLGEGQRVRLAVRTRSHYLYAVAAVGAVLGIAYDMADYDALRSLPLAGGGSRSAFAPDGLVPGSGRGERFLFWPMGIRSAGAMRQWGTHATAFLGRRHFDDADLIERRFRLLE